MKNHVMSRLELDSIAVSIFVDILVELTNTVSEANIQITLLIVRRGALTKLDQIVTSGEIF